MRQERDNFGTKIGVVLATAGSAVGLGNIWRFPYMTGEHGGAAFILVYIVFVIFLGVPGMIAEFVVGRSQQSNVARAYRRIAPITPSRRGLWGVVIGYMGVATSMIILGFYAVVAGWCMQYLCISIAGGLHGDVDAVTDYFHNYSTQPLLPALWSVAFILITLLVVVRGVHKGIERASKIMMPLLFLLLLIIVAASCMLPGAFQGITFLFHPDFSKIDHNVLLGALGQAFFSLSLGTGCLCTYASYFSRGTNLMRSAGQIALVDTLIAILAGLMIFPAAFSVGVNPDSGPSLIFITLPNVFNQAFAFLPWLGRVISILFYSLLCLAALTSTISLLEIGTAFAHEELRVSRTSGAWITTVLCSLIAIGCSLSVGGYSALEWFSRPMLDFCDFLSGQILLPLGGLLTCLFVGWFMPQRLVRREFLSGSDVGRTVYMVWLWLVRLVCPVFIALIFLNQFKIV